MDGCIDALNLLTEGHVSELGPSMH